MPHPRPLSLILLLGLLAPPALAAEQQTPINALYLQVSALSTLYDLDATPAQLMALQTLSADTPSAKPLPPSPHPGRPYRSALTALRDAYVHKDDDEIGDCQERLDDLEEKMAHPPDPVIAPTDAAKRKSAAALKLFTPAQLAEYISARTDDAPDPAASLIDALDSVRDESDKEFAATRAATAEDLATLLAGLDGPQHQSVSAAVAAFLDKAHAMPDDAFKSARPALEKEAHHLADPSDPAAVLTHWLQRDLADLLSNPQLPAALAARLK